MTVALIREKLHDYIENADDKKVEAIYLMVEGEIDDEKYDRWEDEEFLKELKSRLDDFESGIDKGSTWEEVKLRARNRVSAKH